MPAQSIVSLALFLAAAMPILPGCSSDSGSASDAGGPDAVTADAAPMADAGPSYQDADWLFEPNHLLDIEIEITEPNWDALRFQSRNVIEILGPDCGTKPAYSPFTYVTAEVTVDGQLVENVGVRKKGFLGSLDDNKPSLKIKFDQYVMGQSLSGLTRMTLNNNKQDPSHMNQCLGYRIFREAGIPAPRCNFAKVSINGVPFGIFTHVESVKKPFIATWFADDSGNLYEGTLSDFRAGWTGTFERKTNKSNPPGTEDRSDLQAVVDALALGDAAMVAELETLIDLDQFFRFWAVETMLSHWDGYAGNNNNFFVYGDPVTGKLTFMPWGIDQLFGNLEDPGLTRSVLTRRLYLYAPTRTRYLQHYEQILDTVWDDATMLAEMDRIEALIASSMSALEAQPFADTLPELRSALNGREQRMRNDLALAGPGDADNLATPLCFKDVGTLTSTFSATYGAAAQTVTLEVVINGNTVPLLGGVNVFAGPSEDVQGQSVLYLVSQTTGSRDVLAFVAFPDELVTPGTIDVGTANIESVLFFVPAGGGDADEVYFNTGTMTLSSGAVVPGSTWNGTLDLRLWNAPWL